MGETPPLLKAVSEEEDIVLRNIFYDTRHPAGFSTVPILAKATGLPEGRVRAWLQGEEPYTMHRPVRKNFQRNAMQVFYPDDVWQADLVDMSSKADANDQFKFILTVIDVFSKMAFARALASKAADRVTEAFLDILHTSGRKPTSLQCDKGTEFVNDTFQAALRREGIRFYTSNDPHIKCAVIERWNRTLKTRMWKFFTFKGTYRWVDELPNFVEGYNRAKHSTIGMAPRDVNEDTQSIVFERLKKTWPSRPSPAKADLAVGCHVRVAVEKGTFDKGYEENWSQETFKIRRKLPRVPVVYILEDLKGDIVKGTYYSHELQKVTPPSHYKIERVLRTQKQRDGRVRYFVKFRGYPDQFNAWVDELVHV